MATPIFSLKSTVPVGIVEVGDKIALGYQYFKSSNLTSPEKVNVHSLHYPGTKYIDFGGFLVGEGSQITPRNTLCRVYAGTITDNPNLDTEFKMQYLFTDKNTAYVVGFREGVQHAIINTETATTFAKLSSSSVYYYTGVLTQIGENEFLSIVQNSYYDRVLVNYRTKCDGMSVSQVHGAKVTYNYACAGYLAKTPTTVYNYVSYQNNNFKVQKYDISSQSQTDLVVSTTGAVHITQPSNFFEKVSTDTQKVFYTARYQETNTLTIEMYTLDISEGKCTKETCTINGTPDVVLSGSDSRLFLKSWIMYDKSSDKYYLNVIVCARSDYNPDLNVFRLYTFELNPDSPTELTFVTQYNFTQKVYGYVYLDTENKNKVCISGSSDAEILTFVDGSWSSVRLGTGEPNFIVYDGYGRLWIVNSSNKVYMLLPQIPAQIVIKPENTEYDYVGTTIPTKVYVSAYNFDGERVAVNGKLVIMSDNAEFTDGSKSKEVTTSTTGDVAVDINITGPGIITIIFDVNYTL